MTMKGAGSTAARTQGGVHDRPLAGIACKVIAAFLFSLMFAAIRWLGPYFPVGEIVFFRSAIAAIEPPEARGLHSGAWVWRAHTNQDSPVSRTRDASSRPRAIAGRGREGSIPRVVSHGNTRMP